MKSKEHPCKTLTSLRISEPLARRLAAYSATAGAALLAAPVANATIQNINNLSVSLDLPSGNGSQNLSFDVGPFNGYFVGNNAIGVSSLTHTHFNSWTTQGSQGTIFTHHSTMKTYTPYTYRFGNAAVKGNIAAGFFASRLDKGAAFAGLPFGGGSHLLASRSRWGANYGSFMGQSGYVAFKTSNSKGTYYGWLKVKVDLDPNGVPDRISLVDNGDGVYGAYDKTSDALADNFTAGAIAVPEPSLAAIGGLSLLAFGAAGVRELRRRKAAAQK